MRSQLLVALKQDIGKELDSLVATSSLWIGQFIVINNGKNNKITELKIFQSCLSSIL